MEKCQINFSIKSKEIEVKGKAHVDICFWNLKKEKKEKKKESFWNIEYDFDIISNIKHLKLK